jgi:hypothetical protein
MSRRYFPAIIAALSLILLFRACAKKDTEDGDRHTGQVTGVVYSASAGSTFSAVLEAVPLAGAKVEVAGSSLFAATDPQGRYSIENVPSGSQTLKASATGYASATATLIVPEGESISQDFTLQPESSGNIYYVSPSGNNAHSGTSESPWATPGYASRQLKPGDTLIIMPGKYPISIYDDDIILPTSGTPAAWITIKGQNGAPPRLEGSANLICAIDISHSSYIKIQNLEITSASGEVIRDGIAGVEHDINGVLLENLYIHHINEFGINISDVNDIQILNCRLDYCGMGGIGGPVGYLGGWRNAKISGCSLSYSGHFYNGGENPYDRPDGFGIEPSDGPIEISDTVAEHNLGDGLDSKSANTYIHHCIVANNRCDGVKLWQGGSKIENTLIYGTGDGDPTDSPWAGIVIGTEEAGASFQIINVTLHENAERRGYPIYVQYDSSVPVSVLLRNTIVANAQGHAHFGDSVTLIADHNLFYMPSRDDQVYANGRDYLSGDLSLLGEGNAYGNPLFISPAWGTDGNYKLQAASPALNTGTSNGAPADDLEHTTRPQGAGIDKGAYEQ